MLAGCKRALAAEMSFDELVAAFPQGEPDGEYAALFYEDLVDGVEHVPGNLLGKVDLVAWKGSEMHAGLVLHSSLLHGPLDEADSVRIYHEVRSKYPLTVEGLDAILAEAKSDLRNA